MIQVVQVVDDRELLARIASSMLADRTYSEVFWIQNLDTSKMVDNQAKLEINVWRVVGRKQYESAFGQRTVWLAEPFNLYPWIEALPQN